jgi:CheY-like chemotaxis protein
VSAAATSAPTQDGEAPAELRVLLVDDDRLVGAAFSRMLRPFEVVFAQSAVGALARLQAGGKFDAVVCDFHMPGMDGMAFHGEVAKLLPALARQIVFVTGGASSPEAAAFLARHSNTCLLKPVDRDVLKAAVVAAAAALGGA